MKYHFSIKKNIFMYNHLITCTCGEKKYEAICESLPAAEETIVFWPESFELSPEETEVLTNDLIEWSKGQGFTCLINPGKR